MGAHAGYAALLIFVWRRPREDLLDALGAERVLAARDDARLRRDDRHAHRALVLVRLVRLVLVRLDPWRVVSGTLVADALGGNVEALLLELGDADLAPETLGAYQLAIVVLIRQ